ncbi:unnamed protein product [Ostreobium quekettii]|uniref:Uncharacterized protein n=1 Tax=Ostreobium quekettii TaxID=121088 RepID=A0A8S1IW96_9CHLO|nr:unnamed protein product [Ostreobium quekettii]
MPHVHALSLDAESAERPLRKPASNRTVSNYLSDLQQGTNGQSGRADAHGLKDAMHCDAEGHSFREEQDSAEGVRMGCCICLRRKRSLPSWRGRLRLMRRRVATLRDQSNTAPHPWQPKLPRSSQGGSQVESADSDLCGPKSNNLVRQGAVAPAPEALDLDTESLSDDDFYSVEDVEIDEDSLYTDPDGTPEAATQNPLTRAREDLRSSSLKKRLSSMMKKLSFRRDAGRVDHLLLHEPMDDVDLRSGPPSADEFAEMLRFVGTWKADRSASDEYDGLCKVMQLGYAFKKALDASDTMKIEITQEELIYTGKVLGLFSLVERRPWSGDQVPHRRRDLRRGRALASVKRRHRMLVMLLEWKDPMEGKIVEHMQLSEDAASLVLRVDLRRKTGNAYGQEVHLRLVFRRVG